MSNNGTDLLNLEPGKGEGNGNSDGNSGNNTPDPNNAAGANDGNGASSNPSVPGNNGAGKGDDKSFEKSWKDYIPEELKDRTEWNNIKDPSDLFKNYINAQQMISKSVRIPDEGASPEDISNFYSKLGKPKTKEEYDFEYTPAKNNYIYTKDSFDFTMFKDIADKANLTKDQYQKLASAYVDANNENYLNYNQALQKKAAEELKQAEHQLKTAWGERYNQNINAISEKVKKLYPEKTLVRMQNAGLFRDPEFLEAHLKLTKMMTGDTVFIEGNAVENVPQTLQSLTERRDKLMSEDYAKNKDQVLALNQQIVKLRQAQTSGAMKYRG